MFFSRFFHVFIEHLEGGGWVSPVHCFFVDGRGISESVKIELESSTEKL